MKKLYAYVVVDKKTGEIETRAGISFNKKDVEVNKAYSKYFKVKKYALPLI